MKKTINYIISILNIFAYAGRGIIVISFVSYILPDTIFMKNIILRFIACLSLMSFVVVSLLVEDNTK